MQSNIGSELSYLLPRESVPQFGMLFRNLEDTKAALGVESFGCSSSTMEEVFLKVGLLPCAKRCPDRDLACAFLCSRVVAH